MITKLRNEGPCKSVFSVETELGTTELIGWAIVGGSMALDFKGYSPFSKRYNYCPERDSTLSNWKQWDGVAVEHYADGEKMFYQFVKQQLPRKQLNDARIAIVRTLLAKRLKQVPLGHTGLFDTVIRKRFHDQGNMRYFWCEWRLHASPGPVTVSSEYYTGRCGEMVASYLDDYWQQMRAFFNSLFDAGHPLWCDLNEDTFQAALNVLKG